MQKYGIARTRRNKSFQLSYAPAQDFQAALHAIQHRYTWQVRPLFKAKRQEKLQTWRIVRENKPQ